MPESRIQAERNLKREAHRILTQALKSYKLIRPGRCEDCGETAREGIEPALHGHHPDYSKPLEVEWLCPRCHRARHSQGSRVDVPEAKRLRAEGQTLQQIGDHFGVTRERVRQKLGNTGKTPKAA